MDFSLTERLTDSGWPAGEVATPRVGHRRAESSPGYRSQLPEWASGIVARLLNAEDRLLPTEHRLGELAAMGMELDALFVNPACAPGLAPESRSAWSERFLQRATNLLQEELLPDLCRRGVCVVP